MTSNRQCDAIEKQQHDAAARAALLDLLRTRHADTGSRFDVAPTTDRDVLLVASELLANPADITSNADRTIADAGFEVESIGCLDDRVVRIHRPNTDRERVDDLRAALAAEKVQTSFAYVTPNKVVIKSEATPERADHGSIRRVSRRGADHPALTVPVAILDTGVALCGRDDGWLQGLETEANRDPLDVFPRPNGLLDFAAGHGTFIAGLFEQVDGDLDLRVRRVLDTDGIVGEVDVACALVTCVREEVTQGGKLVVNLSLGTDTLDGEPPLALRVALDLVREIEDERSAEVMLVAAAGNDGLSQHCWPAAFAETDDRVIAVAALDEHDRPANWSTHGPWVTCSTVGVSVVSTFVTGKEDPGIDARWERFGRNAWASWTGTSFAAPQVAARIASIAAARGVSLAAAKEQLFADAGIGTDPNYGTLLKLRP